MAILVLVIGTAVFAIGIVGQFILGKRHRHQIQAGDRRGLRLVLTLAAIIVGAWMVIASATHVLHNHARVQHGNVTATP